MPIVETRCGQARRVRQTNSTDASFPSLVPTKTAPAGVGDAAAQTTKAVFELTEPVGGNLPNAIRLEPYGRNAADLTFKMRVVGWHRVREGGAEESAFWKPVTIGEFLCTIGTAAAGCTDGLLTASDLAVDTISVQGTSGTDGRTCSLMSPADNTQAHVTVDIRGFQRVEVTFDRNSSATQCNALGTLIY